MKRISVLIFLTMFLGGSTQPLFPQWEASRETPVLKAAAPLFAVSKSSIDFGTWYPYHPKLDSVYVKNPGTAMLLIDSIRFTMLMGSGSYSESPNITSIAPNDSVKMYITYWPGYYRTPDFGYCIFYHSALSSPDTINLSGIAFRITNWYWTSLPKFGDCVIGKSITDTAHLFTQFGSVWVDSARSLDPQFSIVPTNVVVTGNQTFTVAFAPTKAGPQSSEIWIFYRVNGDTLIDKIPVSGTGIPAPAPWFFTNTGMSHTVVITLATNPTINGTPLSNGDCIGVFYDSSGTPACAGYSMWDGLNNITVAAFGDDALTSLKDGFAPGESFQWKIYRVSDGKRFDATATYSPVGGIITNTSAFAANGISQLLSLSGSDLQTMSLRSGWSNIACWVEPTDPTLDSVFKPIVSDVIILKNSEGKTYIPSLFVNTIGPWVKTSGYQLKMSTGRSLIVRGRGIQPEFTPITLPLGWGMLPFICREELPIAATLSRIVSSITIVKNQEGQTYIPSLSVNSIGTLKLGQAYQIKLSAAEVFTYPANPPGTAKVLAVGSESQRQDRTTSSAHYRHPFQTNTNATLAFPASSVSGILQPGDEVGVYTQSGTLVGCGQFEGQNFAVAVWGDDPTTPEKDGMAPGEPYDIRFWSRPKMSEEHLSGIEWKEGAGVYEPDGLHIVKTIGTDAQTEIPAEFTVMQNYPNPFNPTTTIRFSIPTAGQTRITVFNTLGERTAELINGVLDRGYHEFIFDAQGLASGIYYYRIENGTRVSIKQMVLVK